MTEKEEKAEKEQRPSVEPQKHFATMVIGVALVAIGAILINQGMNAVQSDQALLVGIGLIAAGSLLVFAGASRVWPDNILANLGMLAVGIVLIVASGTQIATNWGLAVYGIALTVVGIALIVVGVQIAKQSWERYTSREASPAKEIKQAETEKKSTQKTAGK